MLKTNGKTAPSINLRWPTNPADGLLSRTQWQQVSDAVGLTARELQVTKLLLQGLTRAAIAEQLGMQLSTVRHHLQQIHSKLGVTNRVGVALRIVSLRDQLCE